MPTEHVALLSRPYGRWVAYLLLLVTPGSFIVIPLVFLARWLGRRQWRCTRTGVRPEGIQLPSER